MTVNPVNILESLINKYKAKYDGSNRRLTHSEKDVEKCIAGQYFILVRCFHKREPNYLLLTFFRYT